MKTRIKNHTEIASTRLPFGRIGTQGSEGGKYLIGTVVTIHGIVSVYSQGDEQGNDCHSRFDFVKSGKLHIKYVNRRMTKRGLVTVGNKFASELGSL